jgi:aminocarboxymuconate-semialdehyde decarboxylase
MLYIDAYCHILPPKYQAAMDKILARRDQNLNTSRYAKAIPILTDLDTRFRMMDRYPGYMQVLTVAAPSITKVASPDQAVEMARIANDELAELVDRHPDRFAAGIACLPLNDVDAALEEADRAIKDLRLRGIEMYTDIGGKPLDAPEFMPLYEKMVDYNLPIFIHPQKEMNIPDYQDEEISKYRIWTKLGWPMATSKAMVRLVYGGVLEKYPGIKFVTHHCGGTIPYLAGRIDWSDDFNEMRMGHRDIFLRKKAVEYFREFIFDTAVNGNTAALQCGLAFCGIDRLLFATDLPFDNQGGYRLVRDTIESVDRMNLDPDDRRKAYQDNAIRLMRLPLNGL